MTTTYTATCPCCGQQLAPVAQGPAAAPWLCAACCRGWWAAELTPDARAIYRPERDDFRPHKDVRAAVATEAQLAIQRGSSLRSDQLSLVPPATLQAVAGRPLATDFAAALAATLKGPSA